MNKIFTSILALTCASMAYADGFHLVCNGEKITSDASLKEIGWYESEVVPGVLTFVKWEAPEIAIVADHNTNMTLKGTCDDAELAGAFQDCTMVCKEAPFQTDYDVEANTPFELGIHRGDLKKGGEIKTLVGKLSVYETANPSNKIELTITFSDRSAEDLGGVDNVAVNGEFVRLESGNSLSYNVNGNGRLEVYSILGTRLVDRAVSGNGSLDLSGLGRGVYIYRAGRISGKIVVK